MTRGKKILVGVSVLVIVSVVALLSIHNELTDRVNPFISEETSYAKVPLRTRTYRNIEIYSKNGQKLSYTLKFVQGYDTTRKFASIQHKGQYDKRISYVSKPPFLE